MCGPLRAHPMDLYALTPSVARCALTPWSSMRSHRLWSYASSPRGPLRAHPVCGPLRAQLVNLYALTPSVILCTLAPWSSTRSPRLWSSARSRCGPLRALPVCGRMRAHPVDLYAPILSEVPCALQGGCTSSCSITSSCLMRFTTWFLHIITASYGVQGLIASCHIGTTKITH